MKTFRLLPCLVLLLVYSSVTAQDYRFRSGIFLHHSTGNNIWGNNGSSVTVPDEIDKYNAGRSLSGTDAVSLEEEWWPSGDNEWYSWYRIFRNEDYTDDIGPALASNAIVVIKSCFPSSSMSGTGSPSDTSDLSQKTVYNYKYLWRGIVSRMQSMPGHFFVIWTNAPLAPGSTSNEEAALSHEFCTWAKDTLAAGLDDEFGEFPDNVYVFDFFHKLADASGKLPLAYAESMYDSHPNQAATALVAPQFVQEVFDAALNYETVMSSVPDMGSRPGSFVLYQNIPNPFNPATCIVFTLTEPSEVKLDVFSVSGKNVGCIARGRFAAGLHRVMFNGSSLSSGVYLYRISTEQGTSLRKMLLVK